MDFQPINYCVGLDQPFSICWLRPQLGVEMNLRTGVTYDHLKTQIFTLRILTLAKLQLSSKKTKQKTFMVGVTTA